MYYGAYKRKTLICESVFQNSHPYNIQVHSGRQTRPITLRALRHCNSFPDKIEDEPHFWVECSTDIKIKTNFLELFCTEFPNFRTLSDNNQKYNFIMKIHDENLLKRLAFSH